jgi:fatty acid desaturase
MEQKMEEVFSRAKILNANELQYLNQRSDVMGWAQMLSHLSLIGGLGYAHAVAMGTWWVLLTGFLLGVAINFLYAAQHELSHWTVFKTKWLNEFWGRAIGFAMLFPRDYDLIMHYSHHRFTQNWDKDGELVREPYTLRTYFLWMSGLSYWYNRITGMYRRAMGVIIEPYIHKNEEKKVITESRLHWLGYGVIALGSVYLESYAALTFWIIPMLATKPVHQLQNTIEHLGLSHHADVLNNTRSTRTNAVMRWLCWQMPYHTAHHSFPSVPFWKLRELNSKVETACGEVHRMGWIEFQIEAIKRLMAKDESQYPMDEVWIVPVKGGRTVKLES